MMSFRTSKMYLADIQKRREEFGVELLADMMRPVDYKPLFYQDFVNIAKRLFGMGHCVFEISRIMKKSRAQVRVYLES